MKKIINLIFAGLIFLSFFKVSAVSAQTGAMCGGIQGLTCPAGQFCEYAGGSKVAPHPDASGTCKVDEFNCKNVANGTACKLCQPCPAGRVCGAVCTPIPGTCQSQACVALPPTATPTPIPPWNIAAVVPGTVDLCESMTISDTRIGPGESLTITSKSTSSDITSFGWWFYNLDNVASGNAKPIKFVSGSANVVGVVKNKAIADNEHKLVVDFSDINRRDFNWTYYMPKPKRIRVEGYFKKVGTTVWSKLDADCVKTFNAATVDPTPTPVATCLCNASDNCATTCFFDKFPSGVTYNATMKCNTPGSYASAPAAANKNQFCRNYLRVRGDANGDGRVNILDYFYYVSATSFGAKLPVNANIDFNGDGVVSSADKAILMKSLKP